MQARCTPDEVDTASASGGQRGSDTLEWMGGKKVHILTYGCTSNHVASKRLEQLLKQMGCSIVRAEEAEVIVVNTCVVVARTERRVLKAIERLRGRELGIMGCMLGARRELLPELPPFVAISGRDPHLHRVSLGAVLGGGVGAIQIAEGCNGRCSYCITRLAKGALRSHPAERIVEALERLLKEGCYEIQLTAQDVAAWGSERGEKLPDLLESLLRVEGDFSIRLGMMNPVSLGSILDRLVPVLRDERVFRFVHLPLQSGSDRILEAMERGYTLREWLGQVNELRRGVPELFLATDLIAGFPEESREDHRLSVDAILKSEPEKVNITRFSARPGTPAAGMQELLERVKKDRSRELCRVAESVYRRKNRALLGGVYSATAVETLKEGTAVMRTQGYRSVVVKGNIPMGTHAMVRFMEDRMHFFIGEIVG